MTLLEKLEWAYHTIDEQLKFGLPDDQAIKARERRVKGVLLDAIKELKEKEQAMASLQELKPSQPATYSPTIEGAQLPGLGFR